MGRAKRRRNKYRGNHVHDAPTAAEVTGIRLTTVRRYIDEGYGAGDDLIDLRTLHQHDKATLHSISQKIKATYAKKKQEKESKGIATGEQRAHIRTFLTKEPAHRLANALTRSRKGHAVLKRGILRCDGYYILLTQKRMKQVSDTRLQFTWEMIIQLLRLLYGRQIDDIISPSV